MLNKSRFLALFVLAQLIFSLAACDSATPPASEATEDPLGTIVAATLTASALEPAATQPPPSETPEPATPTITDTPAPTTTFTPTPTLPPYNVVGRICFPGENIPAMSAYFEETEKESFVELPISAGQESYEVKLAPGTYIAYAWLTDFSRGGLYSRAVPCGLDGSCEDHAPQAFTVTEQEVTGQVDLCDWFAGPFNVPYPPGKSQAELTGVITGAISYFEESAPPLRVVAFNQNIQYWYWVTTTPDQTTYSIVGLPAGAYQVVAYDTNGRAAGYADGNYNLIDVPIKAGETISGVNINDWNSPAGAFPADPTR